MRRLEGRQPRPRLSGLADRDCLAMDGADHLSAPLLPITLPHLKQVQSLPHYHRDPFDRMMIAQALEEGLAIVTRDRHFQLYRVPQLEA